VGREVSPDEAYKAAEICALNCLAPIKSVVGSLDKVEEIVQIRGFVNLADDLHNQPEEEKERCQGYLECDVSVLGASQSV